MLMDDIQKYSFHPRLIINADAASIGLISSISPIFV